ncbi:MAG: aminomethyl-transferring glycine dehydrogenase subunit GcvPA [Candidatus Hydrogenedentes bacterium]|nr:aminomethyl-transferring glycine dehydrogenase subunit GcvPA [Candidatus Hydrogenedentota bacterium]
MSWIPATEADQREMLAAIGVDSVEALFGSIPAALRMKSWDIPAGMSEMAVRNHVASLAGQNRVDHTSFLGGGYYDHYIPAAVDALSGRSEFYTAYTPYQPETSQGTLQSIYEYQSAMCRLTGMEFANASLYDGGTAVFEAATMSVRIARKNKIVVHPSLNPVYRKMLETHAANLELDIVTGDDPTDAACVIVQNPSFLGTVADFTDLAAKCHAAGALLVVSFYPVSLGLLKTPGEMGADIAIAEGQSLGLPLGFGGPYLGIMATRKDHVRKMPGRIAGETQDKDGRRGFVLTLQAREQHIRRTKAMSNICSNQALCALRALIHLSLWGKEGFKDVAIACHSKAEYLKKQLGFATILNEGPTFNEFAVRLPKSARTVAAAMLDAGFVAGLPLADVGAGEENDLLIAVTEKRTKEEIDAFAKALETASCS